MNDKLKLAGFIGGLVLLIFTFSMLFIEKNEIDERKEITQKLDEYSMLVLNRTTSCINENGNLKLECVDSLYNDGTGVICKLNKFI